MQQFSKEGEKVWLLRLLVKGIVTNWPNQRFIHVWDQMYVSPSQLSPSALVTPTNIAGTAFWQRGTKSASFTLEQPQTPWISRGVFFLWKEGSRSPGSRTQTVFNNSMPFLLRAFSCDTVGAVSRVTLQTVHLFLVPHSRCDPVLWELSYTGFFKPSISKVAVWVDLTTHCCWRV